MAGEPEESGTGCDARREAGAGGSGAQARAVLCRATHRAHVPRSLMQQLDGDSHSLQGACKTGKHRGAQEELKPPVDALLAFAKNQQCIHEQQSGAAQRKKEMAELLALACCCHRHGCRFCSFPLSKYRKERRGAVPALLDDCLMSTVRWWSATARDS